MFIKEIRIDRYGPIRFKKEIKLSPFTLFFGQNEAGKSLTIDAFVKLIFGKSASVFDNINRVEEKPYGYIVIDNDGEILKLPDRGNIQPYIDMDIGVNEFKNILIVRSSRLGIPKEQDFFLEITEKITGIKASIIDRLAENIRDIANLTPGNSFRDVKGVQLKSRIDKARSLIGRLDELINELQSYNFDDLIQRYVEKEDRLNEVRSFLENLRKAKFKEEYLKAESALSDYKKYKDELLYFRDFDEKVKQQWLDLINQRARLVDDLENDKNEYERLAGDYNQKEEDYKTAKQEFSIFNLKMEDINKITPQIEELGEKDAVLEKRRLHWERVFKPFLYISILIFFATSAFSILTRNFIYTAGGIAVLLFAMFGFVRYRWKKSDISRSVKKIRNRLMKLGFSFESDDIAEILHKIDQFEDEYNIRKGEIDDYKTELDAMKKQKEYLKANIDKKKKSITEIDEKIAFLKQKYKVNTYEEYCKKLENKDELLNNIRSKYDFLNTVFNSQFHGGEFYGSIFNDSDIVEFWENKIKDLEKYKDYSGGIEYSQKKYEELNQELTDLEDEIHTLSSRLENGTKKLEEMERDINSILHFDSEYIHLSRLEDLAHAKELLNSFIFENNHKRDLAITAIDIFNELKTKKREEITNLFGEKSGVSELFKAITGGKYKNIIYDNLESKLLVERGDGVIFDVKKLSSGAFDQLYLSIRIALAKRLFGEKKGFFIMDDPFIRSDRERLIRQIQTLMRIVELGWQILYFSAKDEVKEVLGNYSGKLSIVKMDKVLDQ